MAKLVDGSPGGSPLRGLFAIVGALAWTAAAALGAVMAVIFAASVLIIAFFAALLVPLTIAAMKARRSMRRPADPNLLEARHLGGHSWVAYGWDGR